MEVEGKRTNQRKENNPENNTTNTTIPSTQANLGTMKSLQIKKEEDRKRCIYPNSPTAARRDEDAKWRN